VLIALTLELSGVPALPFAVGVYLPLASSMPIFIGGCVRWFVEWMRPQSESEGDSSPAVLLSSGYIAGGSIAALIVAFLNFAPDSVLDGLKLSEWVKNVPVFGQPWNESIFPAVGAFLILIFVLMAVGLKRSKPQS
jgi:hypothetical protein